MREEFVQFIWQYQYFEKFDLTTESGEKVSIFHPGVINTDAGPDFKNAKIKIGDLEWRGNVEIHLKSSDWNKHGHQNDPAYNNVVLHVVWEHDADIKRNDGTIPAVISLSSLVLPDIFSQYKKLIASPDRIPCERQINEVSELTRLSTLDKTAMERLEVKSLLVTAMLSSNNNNWEETAYQLLMKNFGFKVNAQQFLQLAQSLPLNILKKHADQPIQIQALLFGQAGFLYEISDDYQTKLQKEYDFLKKKYQLNRVLDKFQWKFLRLRPANFPTVRIAQVSTLLSTHKSLFTTLLEIDNVREMEKLFRLQLNEYWSEHYQFGEKAKNKIPKLGKSSIENIIINSIAPLLVAYGRHIDAQEYIDRALNLLQEIPGESNKITRLLQDIGMKCNSALDSQALIQLYNEYCLKKRCLNCNIGVSILSNR